MRAAVSHAGERFAGRPEMTQQARFAGALQGRDAGAVAPVRLLFCVNRD
jgi:hypothetical protein